MYALALIVNSKTPAELTSAVNTAALGLLFAGAAAAGTTMDSDPGMNLVKEAVSALIPGLMMAAASTAIGTKTLAAAACAAAMAYDLEIYYFLMQT
jgi:16S rRNA C1402 (ribose-2'-O) methylase RsmI